MNLAQLIDAEAIQEGRHVAPRQEARPKFLNPARLQAETTRKVRVLTALAERPMTLKELLLWTGDENSNAVSVTLATLKKDGEIIAAGQPNHFVYALPPKYPGGLGP